MGKGEERKARVATMRKLSEQEIERIVSLLKEGKPLLEVSLPNERMTKPTGRT